MYPKSRFGETSEKNETWLNSLSRVDDTPASLSTTGVSEQDSAPPVRHLQDEPPATSPTHNLLQSLRAELQRHQDTITSLKSERDVLNKKLDRQKDLETSGFSSDYLSFLLHMTNAWPNQNSGMLRRSSSANQPTEHHWLRAFNGSRANYARRLRRRKNLRVRLPALVPKGKRCQRY